MPILVVDNNPKNLRNLEQLLISWQMQPVLAHSGKTALVAMVRAWEAGNPFKLVLVDGYLPDMDGFTLAEKIKQQPELAAATVMMLTSSGTLGDGERCRKLGIAAYLTKPAEPSELLEAITAALATTLQETGARPQRAPLVTRHSVRESRRGQPGLSNVPHLPRLRILLAEDNAANQMLAVRLLEKCGHTVVVAQTGREALAALEDQEFDLVLMDVQMPEMDGLETTLAIREKERIAGGHIPIIALTAHAMESDRQLCFEVEVGMDGYLSKPLQVEELYSAIERTARTVGNERMFVRD